MNGYLNNLAIRTLNAGNLVEPRVPSLFESQRVTESTVEFPAYTPASVAVTQDGPLIETPSDSRLAAPNAKHEIASPAEAPAVVIDRATNFAEAHPVSTQPKITHPGASVVQHRTNTSGVAFAPVVGDRPMGSIVEPGDIGVEPTRRSLEPAVQVEEAAAEINEQVETITVSTTSRGPVALPRAAVSQRMSPKKSANAPLSESANSESVEFHSEQTATTPPLLISERLVESLGTIRNAPRSQTRAVSSYARRRPFAPQENPEPESSINVTIGRVEVRATPITTPKSKTARSESPVMPLEEYLRKQRRGD